MAWLVADPYFYCICGVLLLSLTSQAVRFEISIEPRLDLG